MKWYTDFYLAAPVFRIEGCGDVLQARVTIPKNIIDGILNML